MLKGRTIAFSAIAMLAIAIAVVIGFAKLVSLPIAKADYQSCLQTAQAERNAHPNCKTEETLWDRGLSEPVAYYTL
jgi:hypothetical protein